MKSIKNNNTYTKEFNAKEVKDQVVQWIRDWFEENGKGCNAVLGVSGGKDSSIVAALCVEALGKDRVIGVTMPNGVQKDISRCGRFCGPRLAYMFPFWPMPQS